MFTRIIPSSGEPYGKDIEPKPETRFKALELTSQEKTKVIIVGQDPYPNHKDAMGIAFSVPRGRPLTPSLKNLFKSLKLSGYSHNKQGDLSSWCKNGVLLLNSSLTIDCRTRVSHQVFWRPFIEKVIISLQNKPRVYWLMGKKAQSFQKLITNGIVYNTSHPSPIIPNNNFPNIPHFKNINNLLDELGIVGVNWSLK